MQDGTAFTNTLLSDRRTGALLVVISVLTCSGLACIHAGFIFLTRRTFECCEMKKKQVYIKAYKYTTGQKLRLRNVHLVTHVFRHLTGRVSVNTLTTEVAFPPAEADLMCVANGHISSQEVTLMLFIMQVTGPYLITEIFWRNLQNGIWKFNIKCSSHMYEWELTYGYTSSGDEISLNDPRILASNKYKCISNRKLSFFIYYLFLYFISAVFLLQNN